MGVRSRVELFEAIRRDARVDPLCVDELGYMALDRRGAELLFQVLTEREEKNSVAIASNESFSGWTKTFTDPRLCAVRRLPHLRRPHHRDWHRLLPSRTPSPNAASEAFDCSNNVLGTIDRLAGGEQVARQPPKYHSGAA